MATPTFEQLIAYAAGDLSPESARAVEANIGSDPKAAAVVQAWRAARQLVASDDGVEPPAAALARARAIFNSRAVAGGAAGMLASWISAIDRVVARLVYDSRLQPAAVRHADTQDRLILTFETDDGEVDLQAERLPQAAGWRILGQVTESGSAALREIALMSHGADSLTATAVSDERGMFSLEAPTGEYELLIRRGERAIVLAPLSLN